MRQNETAQGEICPQSDRAPFSVVSFGMEELGTYWGMESLETVAKRNGFRIVPHWNSSVIVYVDSIHSPWRELYNLTDYYVVATIALGYILAPKKLPTVEPLAFG